MQTLESTHGFDELFKDATEENGVATVEVAKLRAACQDWVNTVLNKAPQAGDAEEDDETRDHQRSVSPELIARGGRQVLGGACETNGPGTLALLSLGPHKPLVHAASPLSVTSMTFLLYA